MLVHLQLDDRLIHCAIGVQSQLMKESLAQQKQFLHCNWGSKFISSQLYPSKCKFTHWSLSSSVVEELRGPESFSTQT